MLTTSTVVNPSLISKISLATGHNLNKNMNESEKLGRKKNRLNRCRKRLTDKDLPSEQRNRISQRAVELEVELNKKK